MRLQLFASVCLLLGCTHVVDGAGTARRLGKFKQQVVSNDPQLQFMVIGDWGVGPAFTAPDTKNFQQIHTDAGLTTVQFGHLISRTENAVIDKFQQVANTFQPQFIISTGDQFYDNGLISNQDQQFQTKFTDRFSASSVQVPWYPCLGNHDYYFSPESQLNRASSDSRWTFPARYYSFTKQFQGGSVLFVVLDVNPALVKYRLEKELNPATGKYATKQIVQNLQAMKDTWPIQLAWVQQTLSTSTADWKIVIAHEPIFASTSSNSFSELQHDLQPILEQTGVSVYYCGHYHTLEMHSNNGVDYIISGAASQIPYPIGNGTAAALKEYFTNNPIPSPDPTLPNTLAPTVAPPGTTAYPPETAPPGGAPPQQTFFVGGNEKSLPGFMTVSIDSTHMHTTVYGMGADRTWSVVAARDTPKRQGPTTPVPTPAPTTPAPTVPLPINPCSHSLFGGIIDGFNLWSFGTWNSQGSSVRGAVSVAGSVSISSYSIGAIFNQPNQINLIVGGALSWSQGFLSGTGLVQGTSTVTNVGSGGITSNTQLPWGTTFFTSQLTTVTNLAQQFTTDTFNGSPLTPCSITLTGGTWTVTGVSNTMCRIQVDSTTLSNNNIVISGDITTVIVIVIQGSSWSHEQHIMNLQGGIHANTILWVSLGLTEINMSSFGFHGSLLAPNAHVTLNNGAFTGQLITGSVSGNAVLINALFCAAP